MTRALEEAFLRFAGSQPDAELVDTLPLNDTQRDAEKADVLFGGRRIVCEVKSLLTDTSPKVDKILEPYRGHPDFPQFYGDRWPIENILGRLQNGKELKRQLYEAVSSAIPELVRKANRQIRTTKDTFRIPSAGGLLVVLNDAIEILNPDVIAHRVAQTLQKRNPDGSLQFPEIAGAWIISDRHIAHFEGVMPGIPALVLTNTNAPDPIVNEFLEEIHRPWATFLGLPLVEVDGKSYSDVKFTTRPDEQSSSPFMSLSERIRHEYERALYLRDLSEHDLLEYGARLSEEMALLLERHTTPVAARLRVTSRWSDLNQELNHRRIDIRDLLARTEIRPSPYYHTKEAWDETAIMADVWDETVEMPHDLDTT